MGLAEFERKKDEKINGVVYDTLPAPNFRHGIVNNNINRIIGVGLKNSLCLVFMENLDFKYDKVIRAGYPRCIVSDYIESYNHDIRGEKGLDDSYRIAVYAPTYRDNNGENFIKTALPDIKRLIDVLERNHILLALKMHPLVEQDSHYIDLKETVDLIVYCRKLVCNSLDLKADILIVFIPLCDIF